MSTLFSPLSLRSLRLSNRIVIAPMCQYSAVDGIAQPWHTVHLGQLAISGAGLLIVEATAVEPIGRITAGCLGLYDEATEQAMAQLVTTLRQVSPMPLAIQLGHAGRKASSGRPWECRRPLAAGVRWRPRPSRSSSTSQHPLRWMPTHWTGCASGSSTPCAAPTGWASTPSRCIRPTATCCTSS